MNVSRNFTQPFLLNKRHVPICLFINGQTFLPIVHIFYIAAYQFPHCLNHYVHKIVRVKKLFLEQLQFARERGRLDRMMLCTILYYQYFDSRPYQILFQNKMNYPVIINRNKYLELIRYPHILKKYDQGTISLPKPLEPIA